MSDHHLPRYHVRPPVGYVNDPNGPVYFGGRWHLFFQYVYDTPRRGAVVWGHALSADLASWDLHRPAISPDPSGLDRNGCWSGNTVAVGNELVAYYSASRSGAPYQSVVAARSVDGGFSFGPPVQVVADPAPGEQIDEFRDPFVWHENEAWSMLVGAGSRTVGPSARMYRSQDLIEWEYVGPYADMAADPEVGDVFECPQLLTFGDREVLLVASYRFEGGHTPVELALTGTRVDGQLKPSRIARLDGPNFYAASVQRDGGLLWGWITEGRDSEWANEADWSGMLSLPRTTQLTDEGRLATYPVESLVSLRTGQLSTDELPAQFEVEATLSRGSGLSLRCAEDEHLDLIVDWDTGAVTIDRTQASRDPRAHRDTHTFTDPDIATNGTLTLRWFVDGSVAELFTTTGHSTTTRFYPTTPPPWTLTTTGPTDVRVWSLAA